MEIYIVRGISGEYSDHREWPVKAFLHESLANVFVEFANDWLEKNKVFMNGNSSNANNYAIRDSIKPDFDHNFSLDYTGVEYYWFRIDLAATPEEVADWAIAQANK